MSIYQIIYEEVFEVGVEAESPEEAHRRFIDEGLMEYMTDQSYDRNHIDVLGFVDEAEVRGQIFRKGSTPPIESVSSEREYKEWLKSKVDAFENVVEDAGEDVGKDDLLFEYVDGMREVFITSKAWQIARYSPHKDMFLLRCEDPDSFDELITSAAFWALKADIRNESEVFE